MTQIKKCSTFERGKGTHSFRPTYRDAAENHFLHVFPADSIRYLPTMILCLIATLFGSMASAEQTVISLQGGCISPSEPNDNIRLDEMRVTFRSKRDSYTVDALYYLFNTGKTTTVAVGVPKYGRPDRGETWPEPIVRDFISFDTWVNGRESQFVEVRDFFTGPSLRPVGGYCHGNELSETRWMTKQVKFPEKSTTAIRIRYEALYHNRNWHSGQFLDSGYYHDSVGRYWKDKIERAFFVTDTTDIDLHMYLKSAASFMGIPQVVTYTDFISVDEVEQWEPSARSFRLIPGSYKAAQWRFIGSGNFVLVPGQKHTVAPTLCDIGRERPLKAPMMK